MYLFSWFKLHLKSRMSHLTHLQSVCCPVITTFDDSHLCWLKFQYLTDIWSYFPDIQIISNEETKIDVDKFDYILRDCKQLNVTTAFDYERVIDNSRVFGVEINDGTLTVADHIGPNTRTKIAYRKKIAENLEDLFHGRFSLHQKAYQHRVTRIIETMWVVLHFFLIVHVLLIPYLLFKPPPPAVLNWYIMVLVLRVRCVTLRSWELCINDTQLNLSFRYRWFFCALFTWFWFAKLVIWFWYWDNG
jgi:hypothetical protein